MPPLADPRFQFPPLEQQHPNYHLEKSNTFTERTRMWEGIRQFQCLTNTLVKEEFLCEAYEEQNLEIDHFMQRLGL